MSPTEKHFYIREIAADWSLSKETVRKLFEGEPGVLRIDRPEDVRKHKRVYTTMRIPASVVARVYARLTGKAAR